MFKQTLRSLRFDEPPADPAQVYTVYDPVF